MKTNLTFDAELLRRYDKPGPRYTSYPTAPHFHDRFREADFGAVANLSNGFPIPSALSLYVHVPFCLSPCFYCGCNRVITRDKSRGERYMEKLLREFAIVSRLFDRDRQVTQLHLGGGTPNFLSPTQIGEMLDGLQQFYTFSTAADRDISIELDPRTVNPKDIEALAYMGFNRASLGVQDFDSEVQVAVNRIQTIDQTMAVLDACNANRFKSVNVDLIYGLPKQTIEGFGKTLDTVIDAKPSRLAIYSYAHLPKVFKGQTQIEEVDLPAPEVKLGLLQLAIERLTAAGYSYIGMDHFALPTDELAIAQANGSLHRNFMGYTTHAHTDLIGFGVSAISHVGDTFSQNYRDIPHWEAALQAGRQPIFRGLHLGRDDLIRADLIQELMCHSKITLARLENIYGIDAIEYFAADLVRLNPLEKDGLLIRSGKEILATAKGRLLLRVIAACFDAHLHDPNKAMVGFSKAI